MATKTLKQKLRDRDFISGMHVSLNDSCLSEMCGMVGFDFIWIDTEHTAIDYYSLERHLIAVRASGTQGIVRIPWNDQVLAKRVLEMGADGIVFPVINTAEEADAAMRSCIYPPAGKRGFGPIRANHYGLMDVDEYIATANEKLCRCIQIESAEAVKNLKEIVKNPYVDAYIFGPCDLSGSIGELNNVFGYNTTRLIDEAIRILQDSGKSIGISTANSDRDTLEYWLGKGINMISAGTDYLYVTSNAKKTYQTLTDLFHKKEEGRETHE